MKVITSVELQKLGVMPQTIFLKAPVVEPSPRSTRYLSVQRAMSDASSRAPFLGSPRTTRTLSIDQATGMPPAPFEDLRRRLAMINNSATSLSAPSTRDSRSPIPPSPELNPLPPTIDGGLSDIPQTQERPSSPAESTISVANSSAFRGAAQFLHAGSIEKAAPAIGSSRANATGLLDTHPKLRADTSPETSGRSSPISIAGTVKGLERPRATSIAPISTYGKCVRLVLGLHLIPFCHIDGHEPGISNMLEHLYLDNNRDLQADFGPRVHEGPIRRRNAGRHSYMPRDGNIRRLEATLIAHLASHSDAITGLAISPDHIFFASASDDKTVKVWDTSRLERNVTAKPRLTYNQHHAKVKAICIIDATHCFASAAEDGSIHVVRVHVSGGQGVSGGLPKYAKVQVVREYHLEKPGEYVTSLAHYTTGQLIQYFVFLVTDRLSSETTSNLVFATTHSTITILDIRTMRVLQTMDNPRHFGPITCLCIDRKRAWVVCGTSSGILSLWDLRFGILIKSWKVGANSQGGKSVRIHQCLLHPTMGKGRWILVAMESDGDRNSDNPTKVRTLVEVWDIEKTALVESFGTRVSSNNPEPVDKPEVVAADDAEMSPAEAIAALVQSRQEGTNVGSEYLGRRRSGTITGGSLRDGLPSMTPSPDIRAIITGIDFGGHNMLHRSSMADQTSSSSSGRAATKGFMISGSEDHRLRFWDFGRVERSIVLSGPEDVEKPTYRYVLLSYS